MKTIERLLTSGEDAPTEEEKEQINTSEIIDVIIQCSGRNMKLRIFTSCVAVITD